MHRQGQQIENGSVKEKKLNGDTLYGDRANICTRNLVVSLKKRLVNVLTFYPIHYSALSADAKPAQGGCCPDWMWRQFGSWGFGGLRCLKDFEAENKRCNFSFFPSWMQDNRVQRDFGGDSLLSEFGREWVPTNRRGKVLCERKCLEPPKVNSQHRLHCICSKLKKDRKRNLKDKEVLFAVLLDLSDANLKNQNISTWARWASPDRFGYPRKDHGLG
ncbi:hypothetical protein B0H14DRAFT_2604127 [Mycena olivaceomarginata]|nr:hypothetical protein B0H14DRAFT_2604127 [Mycena olivaceomarginata]